MISNSHRSRTIGRAAILTVPLVASMLTACTAGGAGGGGGDASGGATSIVAAFKHEFNTMDPLRSDYAQTNMVDNVVYEPLVKFDAKNTMVGALATEFKVSADAKSVSFTLRDNVTFHDGTPLTGKDVKFSFDRYARLGQGVASQLQGYASTSVVDDKHVVVNLKAPNAFFINGLANVYIMEADVVSKNAGSDDAQGWLQSHEAGTGPFQGTGTSSADGATVARYDKYWAFDEKRPTQIVFRRIDESATERDELKAGNVDVAFGISAVDAAALKGGENVDVAFLKTSGQTQLFFNTSTGATANPQVREGLKLAFDYAGGFQKILNGNGAISSGTISDAFTCRPENSAPSAQDKDKAKQLLASLGSQPLELRYQSVDSVQTQLATLFQSNLKDLGVTVNLVPIAYPDYLKTLSSPSTIPSLMLLNDYILTPDPGASLDKLYNSKNIGSTNKGAYSNPKVDGLLAQARTISDPTKRCEVYKQVETQVASDSVSANLYQVTFPVGYRKDLKGIVFDWSATPMSYFNVRVG